jgi:uncharacterized protein with HEPN domain
MNFQFRALLFLALPSVSTLDQKAILICLLNCHQKENIHFLIYWRLKADSNSYLKDKAYLWNIVDACNDILVFTADLSFPEFEKDKLRRFEVERQLLVIGEACKKLSDSVKANFPEIEWNKITGLRNIIAHEYVRNLD